jgi:Flp pilus assembly protein TadG
MLTRFWRSRRGNFAMMTAIALPIMVGGAGLALDVTNMINAKARLQNALDAAVLASSRLNDDRMSRADVFHSFLAANVEEGFGLSNIEADFDIDQGLNTITTRATARADVDYVLMHMFGFRHKVAVDAGATESTSKIEVVMVLDNTGSMGEARMKSLREAARSLVDILKTAVTPTREIRAALVPFVTAVNVKGEGYDPSWIDHAGKSKYHGVNFTAGAKVNHFDLFNALGVPWKGCVEARPAPYNLSDASPDPDVPDTLFVPYFAPDEPGAAAKSPDSSSKHNNTYLDDMVGGTDREKQRSIAKYAPSTPRIINEGISLSTGPNFACATPIVPLTTDLDKLKTEISKMIHWNGSGTNVSEGLAWGMRVLSPNPPYTQGAPFNDETVSKVVVVFTDGENQVFGASGATINKSDYGSYGFLDEGRFGTTDRGKALTQVNSWTLDMCSSLKKERVEIFTVLLGADTAANRVLYSACASQPSNYYPTTDVSQLQAVFMKIGAAVTKLYVTN